MTSSKTETGYYTLCYDDYERTSSTVYDSPTEINNDDEKNDSEEEFNQINQKDFFYEDYLSSPKLYQRRFLTKNIKYDGIYSQQHEPIEKLTYSEFGQQINVSYSYQDMDEALHIEGDILNRQDDHIMVTEQDQVVPCQFAQCRSVVSNCNSPLDPYSSRIFDCDRNTPQPRTQSFSHSTPTSKSFVIDDSLADKKKLNSSCESFEFPGMTTDDLTSTINVNTDLTNLPQTHTDVTDKVEEFHFNEKDEDIARSGSSSGSLDMEIEKLRNISSSPVFFLGAHVSTLKRAKSCDDDLLDNPTSSRRQSQIRSRSSTPTGRKSPFDIFRKSRIQQFDSDGNITAKLASKKKDNKQKKPADITRSSSPFMFRLKRSNSVSSKDKFKNQRKSKSLNDIKKDFMTSVTSDENEKTKLRQPSPFVRTVFQFVECAFDEDYLGINAFPTHTSDMIPVFSCGGIHTLSENHKTNSLSRRRKSKSLSQIPLHVIHPHAYEPTLVSSGRRIPENDDFIISVIAYLDRIRKAKQKPPIASKRRPRSKRNKSDPVAIAKFLQDLEVPSEDDGLGSASPNVAYQNTVKKSPYLPLTLHQRFTSCREYVFTASHDNEPQETCNSDPILHTISCNDLNKETQKEKKTNLMRKAKSLRSLILPTKKRLSQIKADECMSKNKSISSEIRSLCNLDSDMYTTKDNRHSTSSTDSSYNTSNDSINSRDSVASRNSGVDLVNFIRESKRHDENELQKFPISRSECQCEGREIRLDTDNPWLTQNILKELENSISTEYSSLSHSHTSNQNILSSQCLKTVNLLNKTSKDVFCEENQTELKNMDVVMNKNIYLNCRRSFNGDEVMLKPETKQSSHHDKSTKIGIKNKLKNKQQKRESDDVEYWTGSFGEDEQLIVKAVDHATNYSVIHKKGFLSGSFKRKSRKSSADLLEKRNNSVDLLEKHGEDSIEILDMASNENEKYKGNKKKLITHSSSWKKNRAPVNKPVPTEDTPMETKGTNRFSALLSIFEPSDKKKIKTTTSKVKNISPQELHVCDLANDCIVDEYEVSKTPSPKKKNHSLDININRKAFTPPVKRVSRNFIPVVVTHFTDNTKSEGRNKSRKTSGDQFSNAEEIILRNEPQKDITDRQQIKDIHLNDNTVKRLSFADPSSVVEKMIGNAESEGESSVEDNNEDKVEYNNKESQTLLRSTVDGEIVVDVPPDLLPSSNSNLRRHHVATKKIQHPVVKKKTTPTKRLSKSTSTDECFDIDTVIKHTGFRTTSQNSNGCFVVESEQQDFNNNHLTKPVLDVPKCLEKEKNTPEDFNIDSDYEDVDDEIDYGSIPSIPRPELLLEESHRNTLSLSNSCQSAVYSPSYHYKSYSAMASSLFQDIYGPPLTPKGFGTLPLNSVRLDTPTTKSKVSPPVKPKPKLGVVLNKQKSMSPNIAMVSPFNKNEVHESADDITVSRKAFEHPANNNSLKRSNTITSGEKPLKRTPSVIWARVKHMDVSLVIDSDFKKNEIIHIDSFDVRRANTYKDVEDLAVDTFIKHLQLLDKQTLDLRKDDIQFLRLAEHKVAIGTSFDLSFVRIQDGHLPCQLYINGKDSWSLAAIAYDTLIPKSILEKYLSLILSHQNIMFYGPSGTGKSYIARRLAMFISHRMNEGSIAPMILKNVTPDKWKYLIENLDSEKREFPFVIFLDGFSQSFINTGTDICDLIAICEKLNPPPYIICAVTQIPDKDIPAPWQLGFKWIWLPNHEEPIDGILQRFLRRKFIQHGNVHLQRESFRIADWLSDVWKHINTLIEKFNSTEATLGPTMFYTCPSDILLAEEWFVDLWNYSITPYFLLTVKQGLKLYGQRREWDDPLEWILKSYPWVSEKSRRKMKLRRIRMEDVGYQMNSSTAYSSVESQSEQERLLDFLRQLETLMRDSGSVDLSQFQSKSNVLESSI